LYELMMHMHSTSVSLLRLIGIFIYSIENASFSIFVMVQIFKSTFSNK
jgi:hypothetical protein